MCGSLWVRLISGRGGPGHRAARAARTRLEYGEDMSVHRCWVRDFGEEQSALACCPGRRHPMQGPEKGPRPPSRTTPSASRLSPRDYRHVPILSSVEWEWREANGTDGLACAQLQKG